MPIRKRILIIASAFGTLTLLLASAYYIAIFLPQKQKAEIEKSRLELEAKIEQENKLKEAQKTIANQQAKITEQEQLIEKQKNDLQKTNSDISKTNNTSAIKKSCNDLALEKARKKFKEIYPGDNSNQYSEPHYENYYNVCLREKGL